ncbi:MAG: acyltransferase family protein, partial [Rhizomicrobium sp.]
LDGWRGICALLIALHHFPAHGLIYHLPLVRNAWLLVDFFFVLSGFVITHAYRGRLSSGGAVASFAIRRFFRLWPLQAAILAAFIALELYRNFATGTGFTGERSIFAIFTNLALVQSLGLHDMLTWNTPSWAVSTEFWTYVGFALVVFFAGRFRLLASAVLIALSVAILALHSRYGMRETFDWGIARCIYGFFLGSLTYEAWSRGWFAKLRGSAFEISVLVFAVTYLIFIPGDRSLEYLAPPVFAVFTLVFANDAGMASRVMFGKSLQSLGQWSYAIYLVQMLVIVLMVSALDSFAPGHTAVGADGIEFIRFGGFADDAITLIYLALVITLAAAAWRFIEVPGQAIQNILRPSKTAASTSGANR